MIAYFVIRNLLTRLDPEAQQKEEARAKASAANRKLDAILTSKRRKSYSEYDSDDETDARHRRPRLQDLNLSTYEQTIAMEVVAPEEIPVTFDGRPRHTAHKTTVTFAHGVQTLAASTPLSRSSKSPSSTHSPCPTSTPTVPPS